MNHLFDEKKPYFISELSLSPGDEDNEIDEEESLIEEEQVNIGVDPGTSYKEDAEQDMDDLMHNPPGKDPHQIPPLEDL